jgi:hypothetical protein
MGKDELDDLHDETLASVRRVTHDMLARKLAGTVGEIPDSSGGDVGHQFMLQPRGQDSELPAVIVSVRLQTS